MRNNITIAAGSMLLTNVSDKVIFARFSEKNVKSKELKMKKVLIVITTAFTPTGGLTTVMMNYYRVLPHNTYQIDFCSSSVAQKVLLDELHQNGSYYFQLPKRENIIRYFISLRQLCRQYDVVHINANSATASLELLAAKQAGVRNRIVHNHTSRTLHPILNFFLLPFYRKLYTSAIACSKEAGEWLYHSNFKILKNAIDIKRYFFNEGIRNCLRKQYGIDDTDLVIGHVGKFYEPKNHSFLLDVFADYHLLNPASKLLLVGDGVLRKEIEEKCNRLNISNVVILTGLKSNAQDFLQVMDLFLFPSLYEGMPLSVVEAQCSGLPCFVSDVITDAVCIGKDIFRLPLEKGKDFWANCLKQFPVGDRFHRAQQNKNLIELAGYDIYNEGQRLIEFYNK